MFNLILGSLPSFANINLFPVLNNAAGMMLFAEICEAIGGKDRYNEVFLYAVVLILFK